jgi:hypothetical protein
MKLRWVALTLHKDHLRHFHVPTRPTIIVDEIILVQLRDAREPRVIQPLEIPNVQVRVDDRKIRHLAEIPNAKGEIPNKIQTPKQNGQLLDPSIAFLRALKGAATKVSLRQAYST